MGRSAVQMQMAMSIECVAHSREELVVAMGGIVARVIHAVQVMANARWMRTKDLLLLT
jgi:hypothetical protein